MRSAAHSRLVSLLKPAALPVGAISSHRSKWFIWFALGLQPILYAFTASLNLAERFTNPDHMRWTDPDSVYLMNGLTISNGIAPWHTEHPGTVLKMFNALVAVLGWRAGLFGDEELTLTQSVVLYAEQYQLLISSSLVLLTIVAMVLVGSRAASYLGLPLALLAQSAPLLLIAGQMPLFGSLATHIGLGNRPESFSIAITLLAFATVVPVFKGHQPTTPQAMVLGLLLGTLLSLKLSNLMAIVFLPLLWRNRRAIIVTFATSIGFFLLLSIPILTRLVGFISILQTRSTWGSSLSISLKESLKWFPSYLMNNFWFIALPFFVALITLLTILISQKKLIVSASFWRNNVLSAHIIFLLFCLISIFLLLAYVDRFDVFWAAPLVTISVLGVVISLNAWSKILSSGGALVVQGGLLIIVLIGLVVFEVNGLATSLSRAKQVAPSSQLRLSVEELIATDNVEIVHDYSVLWSYTPLVTRCAALLNGDAFAREIAAPEVSDLCAKQSLAGISKIGVLPLGPFLARDPGRPLKHAQYCDDYRRILTTPRPLYMVTPAQDFDYIESEAVIEEGGWRLSRVNSIDCTGSPVRDEKPNPATLAARERVSRLPVVGPIYRNWPFKD